MTNKELRRLSRRDLLEMLISQTKELNRVKKDLSDAHEALNERRILLAESGSIAEAALKLNKVFEAAQEAADQYLENIQQIHNGDDLLQFFTTDTMITSQEDLLKKTRRECDAMRAQTEAECAAMRDATQKECEAIVARLKARYRGFEFDTVPQDLQNEV